MGNGNQHYGQHRAWGWNINERVVSVPVPGRNVDRCHRKQGASHFSNFSTVKRGVGAALALRSSLQKGASSQSASVYRTLHNSKARDTRYPPPCHRPMLLLLYHTRKRTRPRSSNHGCGSSTLASSSLPYLLPRQAIPTATSAY